MHGATIRKKITYMLLKSTNALVWMNHLELQVG